MMIIITILLMLIFYDLEIIVKLLREVKGAVKDE